jgi:tetratricopeptide (TPR) repeat protein
MRAAIIHSLGALLLAACSLGATAERRMVANGEPFVATGDSAYDEGRRHLLAGNYGLAVQQLRAALRVQPRSPEVLNALAVAYDHLGRRDIAQAYFAEALAADPSSVQTLNNIARSLMSGGSYSLANSYLERAAALEPANPTIRANQQVIAARPEPDLAGRLQPIHSSGSGWIERTSPAVQTIVTRRAFRDESVNEPDDSLLPLLSFANVESAAGRGAEVQLALVRVQPEGLTKETASTHAPAAVAIVNGNGRNGMAARLDRYFQAKGWAPARLLNADHFGYSTTTIAYRTGFSDAAWALANALPVATEVKESNSLNTDVLLRIGKDLVSYDRWINQ